MKIGQIKILCYAIALVLIGLGGKDVYEYVQAKNSGVRTYDKSKDEVDQALGRVDHKELVRTGIVSYEDVKRGFHRFNWTGEAPPVVVETPGNQEPEKTPRVAVGDLINVLMLRYDTDNPEESVASITYKTAAQLTPIQTAEGQDLQKGDKLLGKHDWAKVAKITLEGIEFEFEEEGRENETVTTVGATEAIIYTVDGEGVISPPKVAGVIRPGKGARVWREETYQRRPGEFRIGTEDAKDIAQNYPTILSNEIRHRRHRDPKTGRFDGIEIRSVTPGSFASRHGAQQGDIIRSINGHPVSSVAEIVTFVREHENEYTVWEVEVENQGKIRTVKYESPPDN